MNNTAIGQSNTGTLTANDVASGRASFPPQDAPSRPPRSEKIADHHLQRRAIVYVRQSTQQQVLEHRESTARQYALTDRAFALGWPRAAIEVIDEDQGVSGSSVEGRSGFQRLLAEISADRVGLILGLEMSRLARSCKDWHALLEVCAIYRTLLADADGLYDPSHYNDRLLLGLKAQGYPHFVWLMRVPRRMRRSFSRPYQRVCQPGRPSHFLPRWPPRPARCLTNSAIVIVAASS